MRGGIPECFDSENVAEACRGGKLCLIVNCPLARPVEVIEGDAGGYRQFFGDLKTLSGVGVEPEGVNPVNQNNGRRVNLAK